VESKWRNLLRERLTGEIKDSTSYAINCWECFAICSILMLDIWGYSLAKNGIAEKAVLRWKSAKR